jgi:hypothetical protein
MRKQSASDADAIMEIEKELVYEQRLTSHNQGLLNSLRSMPSNSVRLVNQQLPSVIAEDQNVMICEKKLESTKELYNSEPVTDNPSIGTISSELVSHLSIVTDIFRKSHLQSVDRDLIQWATFEFGLPVVTSFQTGHFSLAGCIARRYRFIFDPGGLLDRIHSYLIS